jgi:hypothetical protein
MVPRPRECAASSTRKAGGLGSCRITQRASLRGPSTLLHAPIPETRDRSVLAGRWEQIRPRGLRAGAGKLYSRRGAISPRCGKTTTATFRHRLTKRPTRSSRVCEGVDDRQLNERAGIRTHRSKRGLDPACERQRHADVHLATPVNGKHNRDRHRPCVMLARIGAMSPAWQWLTRR